MSVRRRIAKAGVVLALAFGLSFASAASASAGKVCFDGVYVGDWSFGSGICVPTFI